jgi:type II secretion system protein N
MSPVSPEIRHLEEVQYTSGVHKLLLAAAVVVCFFVAFFAHYPIEDKVERLVKTQLAQIPGCRPSFTDLQFGILLPKLVLTEVVLPASCTGAKETRMRHLTLHFSGPSFSPFGLAFTGETELNGQPLTLRYAAGLTSQVINVQEESLNLAKLSAALPGAPAMEGTLRLNTRVTMTEGRVEDLRLLAESTNFVLPAQALDAFRLPRMAIGALSIKAQSETPRKLVVDQIVLGNADAPVRAKFAGTVDMAMQTSLSQLNLKGEAAFSPAFVEAFPILNMLMSSFTQKDGFYQIGLRGTLGAPKPTPL